MSFSLFFHLNRETDIFCPDAQSGHSKSAKSGHFNSAPTHFCGMPRYNEVMQIAEGIFDKHFPQLKEKDEDGNYVLKIFNPLPYEYNHAFSLRLALPTDYPVRFTEPRAPEGYHSFRLFSPDGNEVPYVLRWAEKNMHCILYDTKDFYTIDLKYPLDPCSWTSLQLKPSTSPVRDFDSMRKGRSGAENRYLKLEITADGSFSVEDRNSGESYEHFNEFLLDGDVGDGWYYVPPLQNQELLGASESATIKLITDSSILIEFEIIRRYRFPKSIDFHSNCNALYSETVHSNEDAVIEIKTILSLERDARFIKARTLINNTLRDYRLRLVVPTGINGAYFASQAFTMLERKPGRLTGNETLNEIEAEAVEKNFGGIIGKSNGQHGVAFISAAGLHEVACHEFDDTSIYVTLFRAFQRTINMNGEEDGELQKKLEFHYSYRFFDGPTPSAKLYQHQQMLQTNIRHCIYPGKEQSKNCYSPIKVIGNIVASALKPSQDGNGVILRLFNPSSDSQNGKIELLNPARKIFNSNLQEENLSIYGENLLCINVEIEAHKILTFKLLLGESL